MFSWTFPIKFSHSCRSRTVQALYTNMTGGDTASCSLANSSQKGMQAIGRAYCVSGFMYINKLYRAVLPNAVSLDVGQQCLTDEEPRELGGFLHTQVEWKISDRLWLRILCWWIKMVCGAGKDFSRTRTCIRITRSSGFSSACPAAILVILKACWWLGHG